MINLAPGLYDEDNNLIYTWQELLDKGLTVEQYHEFHYSIGTLYTLLEENNLLDTKIKLIVSNDITEIGESAFDNCNNLTMVKLPSSVEFISNCAFLDCTNLKSVEILNPNVRINAHVFTRCSYLKEIFTYKKVCENHPYFTSEYKNVINLFDTTLDELLNKGYSLTEANDALKKIQIEER